MIHVIEPPYDETMSTDKRIYRRSEIRPQSTFPVRQIGTWDGAGILSCAMAVVITFAWTSPIKTTQEVKAIQQLQSIGRQT